MFCGHRRSADATKRRNKMCLWSTAGTPELPGQAPPDTRMGPRPHSSLNPTPFDNIPAAPSGLANASRPHSKLRARSPLSDEFCAGNPRLVTTYARNSPSFTPVHSHAAALKSSGAFFRVMDGERCRKRPARGRNALRASQGVRQRGVMVNKNAWNFNEDVCQLEKNLIHTI